MGRLLFRSEITNFKTFYGRSVCRLINLAHGELIMMGAYITTIAYKRAHLPIRVRRSGAPACSGRCRQLEAMNMSFYHGYTCQPSRRVRLFGGKVAGYGRYYAPKIGRLNKSQFWKSQNCRKYVEHRRRTFCARTPHLSRSRSKSCKTRRSLMGVGCGGQTLALTHLSSDVRQQIEVLVILVLAPLAFAERLLGLDKLNAFDPLDHLVAELILYPQP